MQKRTQSIQALEKALEVLGAFIQTGHPDLGVSDISRITGITKSTAHRILLTLESKGFVRQNPENEKYSLGIPLFHLGNLVFKRFDLKAAALPIMEELRDRCGETIHLNVIQDADRLVIAKVDSSQNLRTFIEVGDRSPLYCASSSKALLAFLPDARIQEIIEKTGLAAYTPNTITDASRLMQEVGQIRERGWAVSSGERIPEISSVSAPIRDHTGRLIASLTISGPTVRFVVPDKIPHLAGLVVEAAGRISEEIGAVKADGSLRAGATKEVVRGGRIQPSRAHRIES